MALINPKTAVVVNPGAEQIYYDKFGEGKAEIDPTWPMVQHIAMMYQDEREYDRYWKPICHRGNVWTLNDELSVTATEHRFGKWMQYHYQQGRRRNCGQVAITQKLHRVPAFAIDLADHVFVGHVQGKDLDRLERETGKKWAHLIQTRGPHQFAYYSRWQAMEPMLLEE